MTYLDLRRKIKTNIFTFLDIVKHFSGDNPQTVKTQLTRFAAKRFITNIKRELYCFDPEQVDELELAGLLYQPSYISLETALNYYGLIPDVPQAVTSITLTTTKNISNSFGNFYYTKIKSPLFFGFIKVKSAASGGYFSLARREKAFLDYFYIRRIRKLASLRLNLKEMDYPRLRRYLPLYPGWVGAALGFL